MAQTSEIKLLKRFDQNVEITGNLTVSGTLTGGAANTNYYLDGITKSGNTLTFSVNGATNQTYTFGSNAFTSYTDHSTQGYLTSFDITTQTDPKYLRSNADDTTSGNITISKSSAIINMGYQGGPHGINFYDDTAAGNALRWGFYYRTSPDTITFETGGSSAKFTLDTSGNLTVTGTLSASGYNKSNWDTAYGWGDHSTAGYIAGESDTLATVNSRGNTTGNALVVTAIDAAGNVQPSSNNIRVSGYGIIGNRGTFYVTNGGGAVQIGNGTTHNSSPSASFSSTGISLQRPTSITGNLTFSGDSRGVNLSGGTTSSQNYLVIGEQNLYGVRFKWDSGSSLLFEGFWNTSTTGSENRDLGYIDVNNRIWYLYNSIQSNNIYVGSGGGYFYNDSGSRIRTNHDFYTNNSNTYLYANNLYLGNSSGDNVRVRGNRMFGNNWEIDTDGSAGFGTGSAASQVHIVDTAFPQLRVHDDTGGGKGGIRMKSLNSTDGIHADIYVQRTGGGETGYMSFQVPYNGREMRLASNGSLTLGIPGNGTNAQGRYLSFEGNTDSSGEASGRLFFTEHNSTTASMDNYGMSIGYRGGGTTVTTAGGNSWTGLSQIANGQWGMWGHDNSLAGNLIMYGDRQATYVDFAGNNIQGINDIYVADQIIHTGDTNTYLQFHGADLFRVVIAGAEVTEWGNNYMKMRDSDTIRLGEGSDFRMWHDGTNHYFRNYNHAGGNMYWQGEDTEGTNHALLYMFTSVSEPYVSLFQNGVERLRTINGGVRAYGRIELDDSNTKLLKGSGNALNITTNSGNVNIGPQNTSWCHFTTDRGGNYFDKKIIVNSGIIGSYDEDLQLQRANSSGDRILIRAASIGFFLDSAEDMRLENDGDLHVEGDVIAYSSTISDKRLKDAVETIPNALDKVKALRGVEYTWNKGHREGQRDLGLIAQEVEEVLPEIVREKKMPLMDDSEEKYKTIDYEKVVGVLIEAVKELSNKVEELENKLNVTDV